ncbi:BamA/TamA family outer membrane protein [Silvimonas sp.]|uniref:BamA/TamA family outer membrane protein n=1 Tax=Silvimonas sp. TaxID=2650811 RepID=UPI00284F1F3F|nr:BamA/TamA family outer membrane protein [Silvimonas sp.]MDR3428749.1 BamA/TamA family outer membrane protein [Silvimonas sp.]
MNPRLFRYSTGLFAPLLSNGPKLGFAGGATANYLNQFDVGSPISMTGAQAKYSNTGSWTAALYNRSYWDDNTKRFLGAIVQAKARNDYNNYLGGGPASVDTHLQLYYARYQQRIGDLPWYVGGSYVYSNIDPQAADDAANFIMTRYDIGNVYNGGLGLNVTYDTRNNVMNPKSGMHLEFAITSYNKAFAGDYDYWAYNAQASYFQLVSSKLTIAYNASWLATPDAPSSSQATLRRYRGYTTGENSAENSLVTQVEARYAFRPRWEAAVFGGVASLFDGDHKIGDQGNWYPMGGVGVRYVLDPKSQSLLRMDYAMGKSGNSGLYLAMGQPF